MVCEPPRAILPGPKLEKEINKEAPWKKLPGAGYVPRIEKKAALVSSSKSPRLDSMSLDQLQEELAAKERELAELRAKQGNTNPQASPVRTPSRKSQSTRRSAMSGTGLAAIQEDKEVELEEEGVDETAKG